MSKTVIKVSIVINGIIELDKNGQRYGFNPLAVSKITIGRDPKCTVPISNDIDLSPVQATLEYIPTKKSWFLRDGSDIKGSKKGTWILTTNSYQIQDGLEVKVKDNIIKFNHLTE